MDYWTLINEWDHQIPLVRPLLGVWREEIMAYCTEAGLKPVIDASNLVNLYFRNRLRNELLPSLMDYNPQIKQAIWRMAQSIQGDYHILEESIDFYWEKICLSTFLWHIL